MGSGLLSSGYPSELRAQFARSHHDVGGLQVRKLGRYGRNLLRPPECGLGLLPLPLLQKFKEVLKVETLAPIQGALVAVDCSQEFSNRRVSSRSSRRELSGSTVVPIPEWMPQVARQEKPRPLSIGLITEPPHRRTARAYSSLASTSFSRAISPPRSMGAPRRT